MLKFILSLVVYLIALLLASLAYFTDKSGERSGKLIILIVVIIAAIGGICLEYIKYKDDKAKDLQLSKLIKADSSLNSNYTALSTDYSKLEKNFNSLNENYNNLNTALESLSLKYDPASKTIAHINHGSIIQNNKTGDNQANLNSGINNGVIGNNSNLIQQERVVHPDNKLLRKIEDSANSKNVNIYIRYENTQKFKNRAYCMELKDLLNRNGFNNVIVRDDMVQWGMPNRDVYINKPTDNDLTLFVDMY